MNFDNHGIIVPDVSFYQDDNATPGKVDFAKMKAAGAAGVILRGGQNAWKDEDFADYMRDAKAAGLPRGYYWFYDSRADPGKQANLWRAAIGDDLPELGLWFDYEDSYKGPYGEEKHLKQFALAVDAFYADVPVQGVYTARWWWDNADRRLLDLLFWGRFPLWVAQYGVTQADVVLPRPWVGKGAIFWQFTAHGDGAKYGVESKNIDLNYFNGDLNKFRSYFRLGGEVVTPPETGDAMSRYEATNRYPNMSLRSGHDTGASAIRTYPAGTKWGGDVTWTAPADKFLENGTRINMAGDVWLQVTSINGATAAGWVAITHLGTRYCDIRDSQPPTEPRPVAFPPEVQLVIDGVTKTYIPK